MRAGIPPVFQIAQQHEKNHKKMRRLLVLLCTMMLAGDLTAAAPPAEHPLIPPDTASPRATLNSFITALDEAYRIGGERLPDWTKRMIGGQNLWQWITAIAVLIVGAVLTALLITGGRRWDARVYARRKRRRIALGGRDNIPIRRERIGMSSPTQGMEGRMPDVKPVIRHLWDTWLRTVVRPPVFSRAWPARSR